MNNRENAIANLKNMKYLCETDNHGRGYGIFHVNAGDKAWIEEAIKVLEQSEWITVNSPEDYPKESGDYLTVLRNTSFHNHEYTDITSFDYDGILAEWDLKPQYKVVAWKYFEPYKGE